MYILINACQHPDVLRVLYFGSLILDIVTVIIPIGLILMLLIDFAKAVISSNPDEQIKSTKLVTKRILYAIIVFAIPWIVSIFVSILDSVGLDKENNYIECLNNSKNSHIIEYYEKLLEAEEETERKYKEQSLIQNNNGSVSNDNKFKNAASQLIQNAKAELGTVGGTKYSGRDASVPWCAYFVKYQMQRVTIPGNGRLYDYWLSGGTAGRCGGACAGDYIGNFFKKSNMEFHYSRYYGENYTPKTGDLIFFWYPSANNGMYWDKSQSRAIYSDHIGIVEYSSGDNVYTIEGNTGGLGSANNSVKQKTYSLNNSTIIGYGSWYK